MSLKTALASSRIELPTTFGITYLELAKTKSGKFVSLLLDMFLRSMSIVERLSFRTLLDRHVDVTRYIPTTRTSASATHVAACTPFLDAFITVGKLSELTTLCLEFGSKVTCFTFINTPSVLSSSILAVGLVNGDLEVYKINDAGHKLVYKLQLPNKTHAVSISKGSDKGGRRFQVVLSKGRCILDFDTVAVVSGNTDENACTVVEVIHQSTIIDSDVLAEESILATLSDDGRIVVTDMDTGNKVKFEAKSVHDASPSRVLWDQSNGHLLVIDDKSGSITDYSWSNGLVGVATRPTHEVLASGIRPENKHEALKDFQVNPKCFDFNNNMVVSVVDNDLHVYSKSEPDQLYPISPMVHKFVHEKQTHVATNGETISGITIVSGKKVLIACRTEGGNPTYRFRAIDI